LNRNSKLAAFRSSAPSHRAPFLLLTTVCYAAFLACSLLHHLTEKGHKRWVSLSEGAHGGLGWLTTHDRKEAMALQVREALRVGRIAYYRNFFSLSLGAHEAKRRLGAELRNFSVVVEAPKSHFSRSRKTQVLIPCSSLHFSRLSPHPLIPVFWDWQVHWKNRRSARRRMHCSAAGNGCNDYIFFVAEVFAVFETDARFSRALEGNSERVRWWKW
jgi:hypothetical protein